MLCYLCTAALPSSTDSQQRSSIAKTFDESIADGKSKIQAGRFAEAITAYMRAELVARQAGDTDRQAKALLGQSFCDLHLFRYRGTLETAGSAVRLALLAKDNTIAGGAEGNIAAVYSLLGDFDLAEKRQTDGIRLLANSPRQDFLAQSWVRYAWIQLSQGKTAEWKLSLNRAIDVAHRAKLPLLEALALDRLGISSVLSGDLREGDQALNKAYSLQESLHDTDGLGVTLEHRAELELRKRQYQLALADIDRAFALGSPSFKSSAQYYPIHVRGQIFLGLGRNEDALSEFRRAVDAATAWRRTALPGDASNTQTVAFLHDVYQDYAELAAELALERHDPKLAREALEALASNRAASLREQLALVFSRNSRLPSRYFELLSKLAETQARVTLGQIPENNNPQLKNIRLELSELEDQIGLDEQNISATAEKTPFQNSLRDIQSRLGDRALLSFCLGKRQSFLWAIGDKDVNLYELPAESEVAMRAKAFSEAVQSGQPSPAASTALSRELFGKLPPAIWHKREWLITADGALLNGIPFSALQDVSAPGHPQLLIANHTIRSIPSELLLLSPTRTAPENLFIGVADPIYNLADARRSQGASLVSTAKVSATMALGRLVGSDREIRNSGKQSGFENVKLLLGKDASTSALADALAKAPAVLHFAVHVVSPSGQPDQAALALSLTKQNIPELLTREAIAAYRIPGTLVVLSGCSSDQGRTLPSAGLIGLSRAWLLAGAAAVVVSSWPTPDDSGSFFSSFYTHLHNLKSGSLASRTAAALEQAQLDARRTNDYRSSPSYWAAYSIVSKE